MVKYNLNKHTMFGTTLKVGQWYQVLDTDMELHITSISDIIDFDKCVHFDINMGGTFCHPNDVKLSHAIGLIKTGYWKRVIK